MKKYVIIVAGGSGKRMLSELPKQFLAIHGKPILMYSFEQFYKFDQQINFILVLPQQQIETWNQLCIAHDFSITHKIVVGGTERFHSVQNALSEIKKNCLVAVHDGVRPLVGTDTITRCFDMAEKLGNAIPVMPITESIRQTNGENNKSVNRNNFKVIQTPQVFQSEILISAYQQTYVQEFTDDASVVEKTGVKINLVEGNRENIKITTPADIGIAEALLTFVK